MVVNIPEKIMHRSTKVFFTACKLIGMSIVSPKNNIARAAAVAQG